MFRKLLDLSTTILLASCLINSNSSSTFAANLINKKLSESSSSDLIAQARSYRVGLGDTLGGIAKENRMSLNQILNYNPHLRSRPNLIYVGETINLGGSSTPVARPSPTGNKYTVRRGDTLSGIAIRHGLRYQTILDYNPHLASRPDRINIGEKINVGSALVRRTPIRQTTKKPTPSPNQSDDTPQVTIPETESPRRLVAFRGLPTERREGNDNIATKRGNEDEICTQAGENMRAIAPENGLGYTFDDYPYFFWYFPGIESNSYPIVFTLISEETREGTTKTKRTKIYEKELNRELSQKINLNESAIIAFPLPASESRPLQEGKEYKWKIQINCTPATAMFLSYSIQRKSTDNPDLEAKLANAPVDRHPLIFAESGVWFDALKMIAGQLEQAPREPNLQRDWDEVLKEIGFDDLIGKYPIVLK